MGEEPGLETGLEPGPEPGPGRGPEPGIEPDEDDLFVPLRPFLSSARRERGRERQIAEHIGLRREQCKRPPRLARGLSRWDIVTAAVAVADAEGADAVSMRRIARELGVGAMSLYWHVGSKEELHQLMLERVQGEAPAPEPTGNWRADLESYARTARAALLRHPWAIDYLGSGPPSGPNDARNAERLLAAFDGLGLDPVTVMRLAMTTGTYVLGAALREVQEIRWHHAAEEARGTMTAPEIAAMFAEFRRVVRDSGRYPHINAIMEAGVDPDAPSTRDERFEFGLGCVLDGIEALVKAGQRGPGPHG
jgi:AcrR family transcriptional regulator